MTEPPHSGRQRKLAVVTLFVTLTLLLGTLTIFELALEFQQPEEIPFYNAIYPYVEFRPHTNVTWFSPEPSPSSRTGDVAKVYTTTDSFRVSSQEYEIPRRKPPGQIRVAMIGGSTVHAGTTYDDTLPGALQGVLRSQYPDIDIEVMNAGITSAISRQELIHFLTTLVDYNLDMLVVYDGINDSGQMLYYEKRPNFPYNYRIKELAWKEFVGRKRNSLWEELMRRSAIAQRIWPKRFGQAQLLERADIHSLIEFPANRHPYAQAYVDNWEKIRRVALAYDIVPTFILQPTSLYATITEDTNPAQLAGDPSALGKYANYLIYEDMRKLTKTFAQQHADTTVLDLSSLLPADAYYDGAHVYDDVNVQIARTIAKALQPALGDFLAPTTASANEAP